MAFSRRERRDADLFTRTSWGSERRGGPRRRPPIEATFSTETAPATIVEAIDELDEGSGRAGINPARAFDEVVRAGGNPSPFLSETGEDVVWEPVALPNSATPPDALQPGALVVTRALAEGQLATLEVLGEDVQVESFYGEGRCIRPDVLVLDCRPAPRPPQLPDPIETIETWIESNADPEGLRVVEMSEAAEAFADAEVIEIMRTLEKTDVSDIAAGLEFLERFESQDAEAPVPAPAPTPAQTARAV